MSKTERKYFKYKGWTCQIDTILGDTKKQLYCSIGNCVIQRYFKPETSTKEIRDFAKKRITEIG